MQNNGPPNYSAFDQMDSGPKAWIVVGFCGLGLTILSIIMGATAALNPGILNLFMGGGFALTFSGFGIYSWQESKVRQAAFAQFLADNGWQADDGSDDDVASTLLNVGYDQKLKQAFSGSYNGQVFRGVIYEYTTGSGRSRQVHYFADLHFELKQNFPLILLDNKMNDSFHLFSDLPNRIPNGKALQLEGEFDKHFKVTVLPGSEQEVLQVLTPDFMSELIDSPTRADIELEASKLFIIEHQDMNGDFSKSVLQNLFTATDVVLKHLGEMAPTWQASSSPSTVEAIADTALTARQKIILKPKHAKIGTLITITIWLVIQLIAGASRH